jgi:hypothetical protein
MLPEQASSSAGNEKKAAPGTRCRDEQERSMGQELPMELIRARNF